MELQSFQQFKEKATNCIRNFESFCIYVINLMILCRENSFVKLAYKANFLMEMEEIQKNMKTHLEKIRREKMKLVFFGQTSNGKSALINAVLGQKVLPSSDGRTTSCFITIDGCDDLSGYYIYDKKRENDISKLKETADEKMKGCLGISSYIEMFWPKAKCALLKNNVQLLDSPGVDFSTENDKWIETYCLDSDVFVYVVNGPATINESERVFFRKVNKIIKNPNIFVVLNKWDLCESNRKEEDITKTKDQHYETVEKFLCQDLKIECDPRKKTFFLSALEQLEPPDSGKDDPHRRRRREHFDCFYKTMCREMAERAVINKFRPPLATAQEHLEKIIMTLNKLVMVKNPNEYSKERSEDCLIIKINQYVENAFQEIVKEGERLVKNQSVSFASALILKVNDIANHQDEIVKMMQEKICKSLSEILEGKVNSLGRQIKDAFLEYAQFQMSEEALQIYLPSSFKEHIGDLESHFSESLQKGGPNLQDRFDEKERDLNTPGALEVIGRLGEVAQKAAFPLFFRFPVAGSVATVIGGLVTTGCQIFPGPDKQVEFTRYVREETSKKLMEYMNDCYSKCHKNVEIKINELIYKFCRDHDQAREIMTKIDDMISIHDVISVDILEEMAKIMSLEN